MVHRLKVAILIFLVSCLPALSAEVEIKTTGGASLGKFKYGPIDPLDALLNVDRAYRNLVSVNAGYIGNQTYREFWRFDDSTLMYDKLPSNQHFIGGSFSESDGPKVVCGANPSQKCDNLKSDKVSRNLIIVTYRNRQTGANCAGLVYVDEEIYGEGYGGSFGDYFARSISCAPPGGDTNEAIARSAHYLSMVTKDGRRIANLKRYDLPKPKNLASRQGRSSAVSRAPNTSDFTQKNRCHLATSPYLKWEEGEKYREDIKEAKRLDLGPDCRVQLGLHYVRPTQPASQTQQPTKQDSVEVRLKQVQQLLERGLITAEEAAEKRNEVLKNL